MMKNIFEYTNYRTFLKDFYESKKANDGYTYRDFSKAAGMNSSSWLLHLIRGTKSLSSETAARVASVAGLTEDETEYFLSLVRFTQAETSDEKDSCYHEMLEIKKRLKLVRIADTQYEYYTQWYHPVIRSLVSKIDFKDDYSVLAKNLVPQIRPTEARKSVKLLEKLGMIAKNEDGTWYQTSPVISTGDEVASLNIVNYHKQVSNLARDVYDRCARDQREISAMTMGIGEEEFERIQTRLREFRREIIEIARGSENADRVYQLNFQFFPVSQTQNVPVQATHEKE